MNEHPAYVSIIQGIGGWNSCLFTWDEDGYSPFQTGFNNTLGDGSRAGAIREAKDWAESEEVEYKGPQE